MKKGVLYLLALCALFSFTQQNDTKPKFNGWTSHNLQGRVKELRLTTYLADDKGRKTSDQPEGHKHQFFFSEQGEELLYNIYDASGTLMAKSVPTYINGRVVNTTNTDIATGEEEQWVILSYLLDFYAQEAHCYINNNLQKKVYNQVNAKGHLTQMRFMDNTDKLIQVRGMQYDTRENLITVTDTFKVLKNKDSVVQTTYRYIKSDSLNNWTQRLDRVHGKNMITEREIIYYK